MTTWQALSALSRRTPLLVSARVPAMQRSIDLLTAGLTAANPVADLREKALSATDEEGLQNCELRSWI